MDNPNQKPCLTLSSRDITHVAKRGGALCSRHFRTFFLKSRFLSDYVVPAWTGFQNPPCRALKKAGFIHILSVCKTIFKITCEDRVSLRTKTYQGQIGVAEHFPTTFKARKLSLRSLNVIQSPKCPRKQSLNACVPCFSTNFPAGP